MFEFCRAHICVDTKLAIIGAGAAGLPSIKHALDEGFECEVFEQTGAVGGTWNYTDRLCTDENGLPLLTGIYKNMITNLPKEIMAFLDFPHPKQNKSFICRSEMLDYLNCYAKTFNLTSVISFYKEVIEVEPSEQNKWCITTRDAKTKEEESKQFDAIMVCNGHFSTPMIPDIKGKDCFGGSYLHSKYYRVPDDYKEKIVLVIGAGPSGIGIGMEIAKVANKVFLSEKQGSLDKLKIGVIPKGVVKEIFEDCVQFEGEDHKEKIDAIVFCTGYTYSMPFLSEKCKIVIKDNQVRPLFQHMINIEYPTMAFIGLPCHVCPFAILNIQPRFFLATLKNPKIVPDKDTMYELLKEQEKILLGQGRSFCDLHKLGSLQGEYIKNLAESANIKPIPPVILKLYDRFKNTKVRNMDEVFELVDDENYRQLA